MKAFIAHKLLVSVFENIVIVLCVFRQIKIMLVVCKNIQYIILFW